MTGVFYRLAGVSIILGATIGGALALGAFNDAASYLEHRSLHMALNVFGWVGLTVVGTAITLLPTILHVRAPKIRYLRPAPWLMFGGLMVFATGASLGLGWMASAGLSIYAAGFAIFGFYVRKVLATKSRRGIPTAALHLVSAVGWLAVTIVAGIILTATSDHASLRDFIVVGGGAGFVFQALLGAWAFLLPSTRVPDPDMRRRELIAMEVGGREQVVLYNLGLIAVLIGLRIDTSFDVGLVGIVTTWTMAAWAMAKNWLFPQLATLSSVRARSERWWAEPPPRS
jgi:nitrite reductase (NO-forming)